MWGFTGRREIFRHFLSDFSAPAYTTPREQCFWNSYAVYTLDYAAASRARTDCSYRSLTLYDQDWQRNSASGDAGRREQQHAPVITSSR